MLNSWPAPPTTELVMKITIMPTKTWRCPNERIAQLESEVASLKDELQDIRREFGDFRKQFD